MNITDPSNPVLKAAVIAGANTGVFGLRVYGGPTDPISDVPVYIDFEHHQIHEGESYISFDEQLTLGTGTVQYSIDVPLGTYPHMIVSVDAYDGSAIIRLYHTATYTGGSLLTKTNRNRNLLNIAGTVIKTGVTSADGTHFESLLAGTGKAVGGINRSLSEFVLRSGGTYRIDAVGLDAGVKAIIRFYWYEDLGV